MNPKRKTAQIDRLAQAIGYIAKDFETFGALFLDALLEIPLNHQGTNLVGYPVAGVVDSVSDDGRVVAEYSDVSDYFAGDMTKAADDLEKALARKPAAKDIFLLSGQPKRPQIAQAFETRVAGWPTMVGKTLHLWGAEEIAAHLVAELIFSDTVVRRLAPYLPELQRIRDEEAVSRLAPAPDRRRLFRPDVDAELARRLTAHPAVTISGLGGLGKSAAAAAFAADHEDDYDLTIWLDAGEVRRPEDLQALPLVRGGESRNVAALLRTRACLLVIDDADPSLSVDAVAALCGPRSHVLLTRRTVTPDSYELPLLSRTEAEAILNHAPEPCPADVVEVVWATVGGHPLTLGLMSAAVAQGAAWADIAADCQAVGRLEDQGQLLADRLLGRLRSALGAELSVFAWAGQPTCGQDFLEAVLLPLGVRKLRGAGLTAADRSGVVRLHDVVFAALRSGDWCDAARRAELDAALETYLVAAADEPGLRFWTIGRVLRPKLEALVASGARHPAFRYVLLSVWDPGELRPELVGDPLADAEALIGGAPPALAVMAVIEAVEQLFLYEKLEGDAVAAANLRARLPTFDVLGRLSGLTARQVAEIQHHKGKALKRLGDTAAAATLFEVVLDGPAPMHETRLQLIDIHRTDPAKVARVVDLVDDILGRVAGDEDVTYSVFLGVVERLPWGSGSWRADVIRRHAAAIERTVVDAANVGVLQAFRAFAAIGRYLSSEEPNLFARILAQLPEPSVESLQTDSDRFAWAEIYAEAAKLPAADKDRLRAQALALYDAEVRPQRFHLQRRAELLIDMDRAPEAERELGARDDLETSEWIQRLMARARLAQQDPAGALAWIDKALERLKAAHFLSEFLELRYDARRALGQAGAGEDLLQARAASQKDAERARLDTRLREAGIAQAQS